MCRVLVLLLVVLVPLRAWAGEVMNLQMAMHQAAPSLVDSMPPGCPMHVLPNVAGGNDHGPSQNDQVSAGVEECAACQLCTPLPPLLDAHIDVRSHAQHSPPLIAGVDFLSAPSLMAFRPPRS